METGTPKEKCVYRSHAARLIDIQEYTPENWVEDLEWFSSKLIHEIFPRVTLRRLCEQKWVEFNGDLSELVLTRSATRSGADAHYLHQGIFFAGELKVDGHGYKFFKDFWGLTRHGVWIVGFLGFEDRGSMTSTEERLLYVHMDEVDCLELIIRKIVAPDLIAPMLADHVEVLIEERYLSCKLLERDFRELSTFAGVAKIKYDTARHKAL